jgi:hypothetical protein
MGNICWLASYPKSGNTWLRVFLANMIADRGEPVPLRELPRFSDDEALPEDYTALAGRPSSELSLHEIACLRPKVHARIAARHQGTAFVKTHNMAGSFDGYPLHDMDVTVAAIYVVRNPLDVVLSMSDHFGVDIDAAIESMASDDTGTANDSLHVSQVLGSWSRHVSGWTNQAGPRVLVVRYEDLLERPAKTFGKVVKLLNLSADRARMDRAIKHSGFSTLVEMERKDGFVEASGKGGRFFRHGRSHQWREGLKREQVAAIVGRHREQMARYKYLPPGH